MEDFSPEMTEVAQSFIAMDDPRHAQLRGITMDAFKPGNMRRLEGWVAGHARDLVDEMAPLGEGDFVQLVSVQLPGRIFGSFFGLHAGRGATTARIAAAQRLLSWTDPEACGDLTGARAVRRRGHGAARGRGDAGGRAPRASRATT